MVPTLTSDRTTLCGGSLSPKGWGGVSPHRAAPRELGAPGSCERPGYAGGVSFTNAAASGKLHDRRQVAHRSQCTTNKARSDRLGGCAKHGVFDDSVLVCQTDGFGAAADL